MLRPFELEAVIRGCSPPGSPPAPRAAAAICLHGQLRTGTWGHSRVRAEVSRRNAPAGRRSHHSSPAPPSVLPAAPPGDCRGLSPRPAAPELTRHLPTLAAAHNTILCLAAGCRALHTNSRLPQSSVSPCALQTRFGEGQRNDPAKPLASPPATASPPLPLRYVPTSLPLPSMRLFSPRP